MSEVVTSPRAMNTERVVMRKNHQSLAISVLSAGCFSSMLGRGPLHVLPFLINTLLQSVGFKGA
jgi:hypothetical protein